MMFSSSPLSLLFLLAFLATSVHAKKTHLRPTKKYLRCNVDTFGCGSSDNDDRVNLCHFNGQEFVTLCVQSRGSIVEHLHAQDYCGACVKTTQTAFETKQELQQAVDDYLDDATSHKRLSAKYGYPMGQWDVSKVEDFSHLFAKRVHFNEDIALWNMKGATSLDFMFWHAHAFEGRGLDLWDVSNVLSLERTFFGAERFQANLNRWNTTSVTNLMGTFWRATSFNSPLNDWDIQNVKIMSRCFSEATSFNQPLNRWNTVQVQDMSYMFLQATAFQQDLTDWQVDNCRTFEQMFSKAPYFQSKEVQANLEMAWKIQDGAVVTNMFTAPRDVSLRAQQLENIQFDVRAIMRATTRQNNHTRHEQHGHHHHHHHHHDEDEALSREILCHGGVCM